MILLFLVFLVIAIFIKQITYLCILWTPVFIVDLIDIEPHKCSYLVFTLALVGFWNIQKSLSKFLEWNFKDVPMEVTLLVPTTTFEIGDELVHSRNYDIGAKTNFIATDSDVENYSGQNGTYFKIVKTSI